MSLTIPALSDFHVHLRQGDMLKAVAPYTARCCGRVMVMPNTLPPIVTAEDAKAYHAQLTELLPGVDVLLAVKMMSTTSPDELRRLAELGYVVAVKLYPEGVTTHSGDGVPENALRNPEDCEWLQAQLAVMSEVGLVLSLHGEMPGPDPLQREFEFMSFVNWVMDSFPGIRVVLEHITTHQAAACVRFYATTGRNMAATITAHHLVTHLGHLLGSAGLFGEKADGKIHPHLHCWPCPKLPDDQAQMVIAATSGLPCFFLGSDSAPHSRENKETSCGCAGVFSAPVLPEVLATVFAARFAEGEAADRLADFTSRNGDAFYKRSPVKRHIVIEKDDWVVPKNIGLVVPFLAGLWMPWKLRTEDSDVDHR